MGAQYKLSAENSLRSGQSNPKLAALKSKDVQTRRVYVGPSKVYKEDYIGFIKSSGRFFFEDQKSLFGGESFDQIFWAGDKTLLENPVVSIIGSRKASQEALSRAYKLAKELSHAGIHIMSGLAKGVDFIAHCSAMQNGGKTIAVIGTPLSRAYPAEHSEVQEEIYRKHLLVSQFDGSRRTYPSDFVKRNRTMCALSDASVIVEASDTSGTLHQAEESVRLGRPLFIMRSVVQNPELTWPAKFLGKPGVFELTSTNEIVECVKWRNR